MSSSTTGLFTGLVLGVVWVLGGFDAFVGTAVLACARKVWSWSSAVIPRRRWLPRISS